MEYPKVAIIIVNYNGWRDTLECLASLQGVAYPNFTVYMVDNGSKDESVERLERFQVSVFSFQVLRSGENLGFAGGNNVGIKKALADGAAYVLLLNNDTLVPADFLTVLVEAAESDARIGIVGPKIYFADATTNRQLPTANYRIWFGGGMLNWLKTRGTHVDYEKEDNAPQPPLKLRGGEGELRGTDYITGCSLLAKREVVERIGLLSEDYFLYYEDVDWCLRARSAGYRIVYVPAAYIWHKVSRSAKAGSASYIYYHVRNGLMLAWRHGSIASRLTLIPYLIWMFAKQIAKLALPAKRMWAVATLRGIRDFLLAKRGA